MRAAVLIGLIGAAACGDNTGLLLTISAPQGPPGVTRIELVLANPDAIAAVGGQITGGDVQYLRQKSATAPVEDLARLDGFVVRIEARDGKDRERFVPLVLAYGGRPEPIAIGAVLDPSGRPMALEVPAGSRVEATATMTPLAPADPAKGVMSGQILEVRCADNAGGWRSGLAWQPPAGTQLRLLFPAPGDDAKLDATSRPLDLDCDGYTADGRDCDDVRARYNPGADELCDGEDMNCDGSQFAVTRCSPTTSSCGPGQEEGVQFCRDVAGGAPIGECVGSPACLCRNGPCARCALAFEGNTPERPCAPAIDVIENLAACTASAPCTVDVIRDEGPWEAAVAADPRGTFDRRAVVTMGKVHLRVKLRVASLPDTVSAGDSVGAVHLAISGGGMPPRHVGIDLQLAGGGVASCPASPDLPGHHGMQCAP